MIIYNYNLINNEKIMKNILKIFSEKETNKEEGYNAKDQYSKNHKKTPVPDFQSPLETRTDFESAKKRNEKPKEKQFTDGTFTYTEQFEPGDITNITDQNKTKNRADQFVKGFKAARNTVSTMMSNKTKGGGLGIS